jgi:hypothetical protein
MFRTECECDWCGEEIDTRRDQYVKARISVITGELDHLRRPVEEAEPTRFFHVTPRRSRDEWDRLGLEVRSEAIGDCCYTRALRAIEGRGFDEPDAGMEWRLMPITARPERASYGRQGSRIAPAEPVDADADLAAFLNTLVPPHGERLGHALAGEGITELDQLEAMSDGDLLLLKGVGLTLLRKLRAFLAARAEAREGSHNGATAVGGDAS